MHVQYQLRAMLYKHLQNPVFIHGYDTELTHPPKTIRHYENLSLKCNVGTSSGAAAPAGQGRVPAGPTARLACRGLTQSQPTANPKYSSTLTILFFHSHSFSLS